MKRRGYSMILCDFMLLSFKHNIPPDKDNKIQAKSNLKMADAMFMFYVTAGVFVFLVAILFGSRAKRYKAGYSPTEGHTSTAHE